ncbi:2-epi-5-epi-valiolone synthase [Engraulis encrasicolus]|uniref:2-epi-5-epi-valiolone synthase n=1 Tax=Engraulis encrasicolus TaxID=184585 RepID=UPI002FD6C388
MSIPPARELNGSLSLKSKTTKYNLVQVKGTWTKRKTGKTHGQNKNEHVSSAEIHECSEDKGTTWTVVSPIVFTYQVKETQQLLDPSNDALLTGHIRDPEQLEHFRRKPRPIKRFVVMDETVFKLYGCQVKDYFESRGVLYSILPLATTEENKSMEMVMTIVGEVHKFGIDRRTEPIIGIGGGVCLDIVGLAASLYRRRTPYIRVPTTLLSYIDASIGAKTGVNFANCKNKLGSYVPPAAVLLDRSFMQTLPRRHLSNGLAELLKMALMKHRGLFELLETHGQHLLDSKFQSNGLNVDLPSTAAAAVATKVAIETMLEELAPNLWEDSLDRLVDFGHVISPELEMCVLPALLHGEAVCVDMAFMVYVARERGLLSEGQKLRALRCMLALELPVWHADCSLALVQRALGDRLTHCGGRQRMPLPTGLGCAEIFNDTDDETVCQAYAKWHSELGAEPSLSHLMSSLHV